MQVGRRDEAKAQTRARLLEAAAAVFAHSGFHGGSVRAIADAAGYTTGALFAHFATKDEIFLALLHDRYERKIEELEAVVRSGELTAIDRRFTALQRDERDEALLATEFWLYAMRHPGVAAKLARLQRRFRDNIARLIRRVVDGVDEPTAARMATALIALGDGLGMQAKLQPRSADGTLFGDTVIAIVTGLPRAPRTRA